MWRIGLLYNPLSERSTRLSTEIAAWFKSRGYTIWRGTSEDARDEPAAFEDMQLLIALGGDGTVLRAARLAIPRNIPILTVAMGRLNFMAELNPNELPNAVETLYQGGGWYEERTLLHAVLEYQEREQQEFTALNEIVLSRGDVSRTLEVDVSIDTIPLTTYRADGVLVATATGSTAYALSAGGPIVDPRSRSMVLVPIAAHLTAVPSMVLHPDTLVTFSMQCYHLSHHAVLSIDGHDTIPVGQHDTIHVSRSGKTCTFARVQEPAQLYASFVKRLRRE